MNSTSRSTQTPDIRPIQYRDLDAIEQLLSHACLADNPSSTLRIDKHFQSLRSCFGWLKFLSWFPNPYQHLFRTYVAHRDQQIQGLIQVSPFNRTASTWRVDYVAATATHGAQDTGTSLLRYCLERIWEARTWVLELEVDNSAALALYRHNGFQPLAEMTYWEIAPQQLQDLAMREPNLPNLMPVSNADAQLLYQLDTASMPPLVRQVFDRHMLDFKTSLLGSLVAAIKQWFDRTETVSGYIFEPQRKAAIGYFQIEICRDGSSRHQAQLTVHPAYTWLYPELLAQMARICQDFPPQSLQLVSADYHSEREDYLLGIGAKPIANTLLMCRSVWHKLRETKHVSLDLQLSEVLNSLQPAHKPVPSRTIWMHSIERLVRKSPKHSRENDDLRMENDES
jgi:RimJ/RimL family protein N-acetyltransferase